MRHLRNQAAALAALVLLAACTSDDPRHRPDSAPADGQPTADATGPEPDYTILDQLHRGGPGRWAITAFGDPDVPMAVVDVPEGFQGVESWVWTDQQGPRQFGQLAYWAPTRVLVDPCDADRPSPPLGPTVADLAAALVAQKRTTTTEPVPVELDGHRGLYLELTSPTRLDDQACAPDGILIWEAGVHGDGRALDSPATDRYWIIDVGGRRVVISAVTSRRPRGHDRRARDGLGRDD